MSNLEATWSIISPSDVAAAAELGNRLYPDYPEEYSVFKSRFEVFPKGFHVLKTNHNAVVGYAVCFPSMLGYPPRLNERLTTVPSYPDCLHLHDIAIDEKYRRRGHVKEFMPILRQKALSEKLQNLSLVAVSGTELLWSRMGFSAYQSEYASEVCMSYSETSVYMAMNFNSQR